MVVVVVVMVMRLLVVEQQNERKEKKIFYLSHLVLFLFKTMIRGTTSKMKNSIS